MFRNDQALWLPPRSVRALLAFAFWGSTIYLLARGLEVPEQLWTLDGVMAALYFGQGNTNHGGI